MDRRESMTTVDLDNEEDDQFRKLKKDNRLLSIFAINGFCICATMVGISFKTA